IAGQGTGNLSTLAGATFDPLKLGFVGQGLGSITGALFNAVSARTTHVALNTAGGALVPLFLDSPAFAAKKNVLISTLAAGGMPPGTPGFDTFLGILQWILDPADPANVGYRLTHGVDVTQGSITYTAPNAARAAFLPFIEGDQVIPNSSSVALIGSANRAFTLTPPGYGCVSPLFCYEFTEAGDGFDATTATLATRTGFLLQPPTGTAGIAITTKAQTQVATFLATGVLP
ncbi:MAG TPA: hypothetical protein VLM85_27875, partial [Polyangiaceae bacterium]|nr:hypothetical protein [Polyangiaceae bacterium]